jgi:exo-1,4-beta-D-glucosaminidase
MGVLTSNGLYPDIFMADSIKKVDTLLFRQPWWYRTEFKVPELNGKQHIMLCFDGISYYANIWLNGKLIGSRDSVYGIFRTFRFDVTNIINSSNNILAVEVFKQKPGDLGHGFVDWNPRPPDDNMGLWREVYLDVTGEAAVSNVFVHTSLNTETLSEASLTITADVKNLSSENISGELTGKGDGIEFSVPVKVEAGQTRQVKITSAEAPALKVKNPRIWWCNNLGEPNLYRITVEFHTGSSISDAKDITFGIRQIESYTNSQGYKGFKLNGKEVLIKGAGWTDDLFFRNTPAENEIQVQYVKDMNLNTIRFENVWGTTPNIYDLCDRYGLLAMVGWSCQWEWENYLGKPCDDFGGIKSKEDMDLAVKYLNDQIRYLQNHPSIFVWMLGSDMLPRPELEKRYRDLIASIDDRPYLGAASERKSEISGPTGVKMKGPYNYVGPSYWYIDSVNGGAYGFNTETGPGPQVPVMETFEKMIPADKRWPINSMWNFHCNPSESFGDLSIFNNVLYKRYGQPSDLAGYLMKSDVQSYEAMRAMFEAFRANRPATTGIVQWMLNSAWPSFYWQLYDYYLLPTSAYYAAKKANQPVQLVYNYGNNHVYAVNETLNGYNKLKAKIKLTDLQGKEIMWDEVTVNAEANKSSSVFKLPEIHNTVFLWLSLTDEKNNEISDNVYWLSGTPDVYDWAKTEWYYTPIKSSADFRALNSLAKVDLQLESKTTEKDGSKIVETSVTNGSGKVAFFINLVIKDSAGHTIYPALWSDNYISLLPGASKKLQCSLPGSLAAGNYTITVSGWNINQQQLNLGL